MLDQVASLEHGDLRGTPGHAHAHQIAAEGLAAPLAAAPRLEGLLVEFQRAVVGDRLDRLVPSALPAALLALLATALLAAALLAGTLVLLVLLALLALATATASTATTPSAALAGTCARFAITLAALVARRWTRVANSGLRDGRRRDRPR
ncbi:MAG: hypothetical protein OSB37_04435 [Acidimicrobiales bacterium]|nr:hypothetical protein [Acidimicrobiales bacterium]